MTKRKTSVFIRVHPWFAVSVSFVFAFTVYYEEFEIVNFGPGWSDDGRVDVAGRGVWLADYLHVSRNARRIG